MMMRTRPPNPDLKPEHTVYVDTGCGRGCVRSLSCPFERCIFDDQRGRKRAEIQARRVAVYALRRQGLTVVDIAERLGANKRTVARDLEERDAPKADRREIARQGWAKRRERS